MAQRSLAAGVVFTIPALIFLVPRGPGTAGLIPSLPNGTVGLVAGGLLLAALAGALARAARKTVA